MLLVDVNLLIHAVNRDSPDHTAVRTWWIGLEQDAQEVGLAWITLVAFVRLSINPKVMMNPLPLADALRTMHSLVAQPNVTVVHPGMNHAAVFGATCEMARATHGLVTDAHLAALAIEHGCDLVSCDADFSKFTGLRWINPLAS